MTPGLPNYLVYFGLSTAFTAYLFILSLMQSREFRRSKERLHASGRELPMGTQVDPEWSIITEGEQDPKFGGPTAA